MLGERGFAVELLPAGKVKDVDRYDGVVLGRALYRGRWHRDACRFLKRHRTALAAMPVAAVRPEPRRNEEEAFRHSRQPLERALSRVPEVRPLLIGSFGGVDREKQVDLRDWDAIRAWAAEVADTLETAPAQAASPAGS